MSDELSPIDFYRVIRAQIEHEDNLNSQRLSWLVASQSFLFTAYAIVLSNLQPGKLSPAIERKLNCLVLVIPVAGLLTCGLIYATIVAGAAAMKNLRRIHKSHEHGLPDRLPPVQGYRLTQLFGQAGPLGLPPIFMLVWLLLVAASS